MPGIVQWERQIGRRLRLRDLYVFFTVVRKGSMARAAAELGVTVHTVSFHLRSIYDKLQVHSKSEAVAKALQNRLI